MQSTITKRVVAQVKDAWTYQDNDKSGRDEEWRIYHKTSRYVRIVCDSPDDADAICRLLNAIHLKPTSLPRWTVFV